jgi:hypothetical protein
VKSKVLASLDFLLYVAERNLAKWRRLLDKKIAYQKVKIVEAADE